MAWLTGFGARLRPAQPSLRAIAGSPRQCLRWLPQLGPVLYLAGMRGCPRARHGVLAEDVDLMPLTHAAALQAASMITPVGPREWLDALDDAGAIRARIYLLPDTDYCAWDGMQGRFMHGARAMTQLRARTARLIAFTHRRLAGLDVLGCMPARVSSLGGRLAAELARAEHVWMQRPLPS